jgi:hypothetical protein
VNSWSIFLERLFLGGNEEEFTRASQRSTLNRLALIQRMPMAAWAIRDQPVRIQKALEYWDCAYPSSERPAPVRILPASLRFRLKRIPRLGVECAHWLIDRYVARQLQRLDQFDDIRLILVPTSGTVHPTIQLE